MDHYFTNNQNLKSNIKTLKYSYKNYEFNFLSDNGVFSKNHLDYGSRLLLETFLSCTFESKSVLDLGCGYGLIGIVIAKVLSTNVTLCDVNKRALHLTKRNLDENKVSCNIIESNIYENIKEKYDVIITNPPIKAGKKVVLDFLVNAKEHLNDEGMLWYVMRKDQGAKSIAKILEEYYEVKNIKKDKGFYIFCCKMYWQYFRKFAKIINCWRVYIYKII